MTRLNARHLLTVMTVASAVIAAPSPAYAAGELRVVVDGGGPLVDLTRLAPGSTRQSTFSAANTSGDDAALTLRVVDLREDDNGCNHPETAYGDVTCGDAGGELGRDLTVSVVPLAPGGLPSGQSVFAGSVRDLGAWTVVAQRLAAGTERSFRLDWELPFGSPNDTQSDTMGFDVEFGLEQTVGRADDVAVQGLAVSDPDPPAAVAQLGPNGPRATVLGAELPATGIDVSKIIGLASMALVFGGLLLAAARPTRRRPGTSRPTRMNTNGS